jgi:hypothetical protein
VAADTAVLIRANNILGFMEREHHRFCEDLIDPMRQTVEIWDIPDVGQVDTARIMNKVEQTFEMIR